MFVLAEGGLDVANALEVFLEFGIVVLSETALKVSGVLSDSPALKAEVKPGDTPGTAILVFTPKADPRVSGKVDFDNEGSRFIGE